MNFFPLICLLHKTLPHMVRGLTEWDMLLLICVCQHIKEKNRDGKYRLLSDLYPAYIMNIQSLGVKKTTV